MVNNCANSGCGKPLHYLREGRIFIFDASVGTGNRAESARTAWSTIGSAEAARKP